MWAIFAIGTALAFLLIAFALANEDSAIGFFIFVLLLVGDLAWIGVSLCTPGKLVSEATYAIETIKFVDGSFYQGYRDGANVVNVTREFGMVYPDGAKVSERRYASKTCGMEWGVGKVNREVLVPAKQGE